MNDEQISAESELNAILAQIQVNLYEAAEHLCDTLECLSAQEAPCKTT